MYIIEMNLDGDITSGCCFHFSEEKERIAKNISHMIYGTEISRWIYVGRCETLEEAGNYVHDLRMEICGEMKLIPSD